MNSHTYFPYPSQTDHRDLPIFAGGNLTPDLLIEAYQHGYFPWFEPGSQILWWSPDPRMVLFPEKVHVSHSMRTVINKNIYRLTQDQSFDQVIKLCAEVKRPGQSGTWIGDEIRSAYSLLFKMGLVSSYETWLGSDLVGGFYGVWIGKVFFGESMFSLKPNASKFALIAACQQWSKTGEVCMIDCQMSTPHLRSLGAEEISRSQFVEFLKQWAG